MGTLYGSYINDISANKRHSPISEAKLGQRRRRWTNIDSAMGECLLFAG